MFNAKAKYSTAICQQAVAQPTPASAVGCFKLQRGRAMTLTLKTAGELRLAHGSAWLTYAVAANDVTALAGDHFLNAGQAMRLKAGQTVVLEALGSPMGAPNREPKDELYFELVVQPQGWVTFSSPATQARPVLAWALELVSSALERMAARLFGLAQAARAFGQTGPRPSATGVLGCQS